VVPLQTLPAKGTMGKAVSYALAQWESLEVYLKEPGIEIDTNLVENAIRPTALGKNYEQSRIRQSWHGLSVIFVDGRWILPKVQHLLSLHN
jgi:hypothetical protein